MSIFEYNKEEEERKLRRLNSKVACKLEYRKEYSRKKTLMHGLS